MHKEYEEWYQVVIANEPGRWDTLRAAIAFLQIVECKLLSMSRSVGESRTFDTRNMASSEIEDNAGHTIRELLQKIPKFQKQNMIGMCVNDARILSAVTKRDLDYIAPLIRKNAIVLESRVLLLLAYRAAIKDDVSKSWFFLRHSLQAATARGVVTDKSWVSRNCLAWFGMPIDEALQTFAGRSARPSLSMNLFDLSPTQRGIDHTAKKEPHLLAGHVVADHDQQHQTHQHQNEREEKVEINEVTTAAVADMEAPTTSYTIPPLDPIGSPPAETKKHKSHEAHKKIMFVDAPDSTGRLEMSSSKHAKPHQSSDAPKAEDGESNPTNPRPMKRSRSIADSLAEKGYGSIVDGKGRTATDNVSRWEMHAKSDFPLSSAFEGIGVETFMSLKYALPLPEVFKHLTVHRTLRAFNDLVDNTKKESVSKRFSMVVRGLDTLDTGTARPPATDPLVV